MHTNRTFRQQAAGWGGRAVILLVFATSVTLLLFWLAGKFAPKVWAQAELGSTSDDNAISPVAPVRLIRLPTVESAVGTIRPVHQTTIAARLLARAVEVNLEAGQVVNAGDVLVRLDDADLQARRRQAEAVLQAAEAARAQAESDANLLSNLLKSKAVSRQENDRAGTVFKSAESDVRRAKESINEIQATLEWTTIRSPIRGIVIDKKVAIGDMVAPGQMLATLYDPRRMRLVASVRETLAHRLKVGQPVKMQIERHKLNTGEISEIVPEAQSSSRAFEIKVTGQCPEGIYSGMFGRILIPLDEEQVLVIPRHAVQTLGQLNLVHVVTPDAVSRRAVRLGRIVGEDVEILSGLREGESVQVPATTQTKSGADHA